MADQDQTEAPVGTKAGAPDTSLPQDTAVPLDVPAAQTGKIGDDIAEILKGVKLPERRETEATAKKPIENKAAVFETALGTAGMPEEKAPPAEAPAVGPVALSSATAPPNPAPASSVVSVHTLKDDLQQVVQSQKISVVRAASLEQDRHAKERFQHTEASSAATRSKRTLGILFAVAILFVLGAGALFGVYTVMQGSSAPSPATSASSSILFAESSVQFPIDKQSPDDLKRSLASARASLQGALGSITEIVPTVSTTSPDGSIQTRPATFSEFMAAIGAQPPDALLRALGDNFFFGIHTVDTNAPVFVIPVTSYDHAFAGMLAWESSMNSDLAPIFTPLSATMTDANGIPVNRTFSDAVMRNYDVRALKDDAGQIQLYYSFPSQNILVIAESPYSFAEILSRLQAGREL